MTDRLINNISQYYHHSSSSFNINNLSEKAIANQINSENTILLHTTCYSFLPNEKKNCYSLITETFFFFWVEDKGAWIVDIFTLLTHVMFFLFQIVFPPLQTTITSL